MLARGATPILLALLLACSLPWACTQADGGSSPSPSPAVPTSPSPKPAASPSPPASTPAASPSPSPPLLASPSPSPPLLASPSPSPSASPSPKVSPAAPSASPSPSPAAASPKPAASPTQSGTTTTTASPSPAPSPAQPPASLPVDARLEFDLDVRGSKVLPWTSVKSYVIGKVLHDKFLPATQQSDASVEVAGSFAYTEEASSRRRLFSARALLEVQKGGVDLLVRVGTSSIRASAEAKLLTQAAANGTLANAITAAGVEVEAATLVADVNILNGTVVADSGTSFKSLIPPWAIAVIVACCVLVPLTVFCLCRLRRQRHAEFARRQQAEQEAARAWAQGRVKPRSFSLRPEVHIAVRTAMGLGEPPVNRFHPNRTKSMQSYTESMAGDLAPSTAQPLPLSSPAPSGTTAAVPEAGSHRPRQGRVHRLYSPGVTPRAGGEQGGMQLSELRGPAQRAHGQEVVAGECRIERCRSVSS